MASNRGRRHFGSPALPNPAICPSASIHVWGEDDTQLPRVTLGVVTWRGLCATLRGDWDPEGSLRVSLSWDVPRGRWGAASATPLRCSGLTYHCAHGRAEAIVLGGSCGVPFSACPTARASSRPHARSASARPPSLRSRACVTLR